MYLVLTALTISALATKNKPFISLIISVLFGIIIEVLQEEMNLGRHFSIWDILANFLGTCLALIGYYFLKKSRPKSA
jgi:glycopeptide antibiotics resistance protein